MRRLILLAVCVWLLVTVEAVHAGSITVTNTGDAGVGCTLREAIEYADGGAANGCSGADAGADDIFLPAGTYTIASVLTVDTTIRIQPVSGTVIIQAAATEDTVNYRVFSVTAAAHLMLNNVTVRHGGRDGNNLSGGCLYGVSGSQITITGSIIEDCHTQYNGGGIYSEGTLSISGSSIIRNNTARGGGGGVACWQCTLATNNASFVGNLALGVPNFSTGGGAISYQSTTVSSISATTFTGNNAISATDSASGGALSAAPYSPGSLTISGSTFTSNSAQAPASSVFGGGAIYKEGDATLAITSSVFSQNQSTGGTTNSGGGAILHNGGGLTLTNSRLEGNSTNGNGAAYYLLDFWDQGISATISGSCITNHGDTAVYDDTTTGTITATGNWWGTSWGPLIVGAGGGSAVSNGDSINGNGDTVSGNVLVDVNLTDAGSYSTPPTGAWLTSAPTVAGATCQTCIEVSSVGHARTCG